ncbi:MAG: hypothetical protein KJI71_01275 [Patescibacteria group bacterium]|nr:hypothetical protein [Patescibacteria group bacterium]
MSDEYDDNDYYEPSPLTWAQQCVEDNTWSKVTDVYEEFCNKCKKDTKHSYIEGSTHVDRYSYSQCQECGTQK